MFSQRICAQLRSSAVLPTANMFQTGSLARSFHADRGIVKVRIKHRYLYVAQKLNTSWLSVLIVNHMLSYFRYFSHFNIVIKKALDDHY